MRLTPASVRFYDNRRIPWSTKCSVRYRIKPPNFNHALIRHVFPSRSPLPGSRGPICGEASSQHRRQPGSRCPHLPGSSAVPCPRRRWQLGAWPSRVPQLRTSKRRGRRPRAQPPGRIPRLAPVLRETGLVTARGSVALGRCRLGKLNDSRF